MGTPRKPVKAVTPAKIVAKLQQVARHVARGKTAPQACKQAGIDERTYKRWRKEYGALANRLAKANGGGAPDNGALAAARAQQAATAKILRLISESPTDLQPIFDAICQSAVRLCDAVYSATLKVEGNRIHVVAHNNWPERGMFLIRQFYPIPLDLDYITANAIRENRVIQVDRVRDNPAVSEMARKFAAVSGHRTLLVVPMTRGDQPVGGIVVTGMRPFPDDQIALLKTFADQAVIAIENARLFKETQESLARQTATSEALKIISRSAFDLEAVLRTLVENAARLCDAEWGFIWKPEGEAFRPLADYGASREYMEFIREHPIPAGRGTAIGRAALDHQTVHIPDVLADPAFILRDAQKVGEFRTILAVPMLREGALVGVFGMLRKEVRPFTDRQIDLITTFADQAVIAIENVRLFNETKEALERQTATADILRVISGSPTDTRPIFDAIVQSAVRLCDAVYSAAMRVEGNMVHLVTQHNWSEAGWALAQQVFPMPLDQDHLSSIAIREKRVIHVDHLQDDPNLPATSREIAIVTGYQTLLVVPMLRGDEAIGAIAVARKSAFSEEQIALLKTFADQAVIAVENVRLFNETREALERQTATAKILKAISDSPTDTQPVLDAIASTTQTLFDGLTAGIALRRGDRIELVATAGMDDTELRVLRDSFPRPIDLNSAVNHVVVRGVTVHYPDVTAPEVPAYTRDTALAARVGAMLGVPLLREGKSIGGILMARSYAGAFADKEIDLLRTFADQAVIAIENVRLFNETKEALERQTATAEILEVISRSQSDLQPVFDTIAANAMRLCDGDQGVVFTFDGELIHMGGITAMTLEEKEVAGRAWPSPPDQGSATGRAILTRSTVQIPDVLEDPGYQHGGIATGGGWRSIAAVPMLRLGNPIGTITVTRRRPAPFSDHQLALLKVFADQAVIAIENVRLFNETKEALEQQTATADVLKVISSSPTDVQPVFDEIVRAAVRLCGADMATAHRFDGELLQFVAAHNIPAEQLAYIRKIYPSPPNPELISGRVVLSGEVVRVRDAQAEPFEAQRVLAARGSWRRMLGVPMLREGAPIGLIIASWREPGDTPERQERLLRTFADQAVIAIENVRLFNETREALERQQALAEVLSVISNSIADAQPVFEKIVESCERLFPGSRVGLNVVGPDGLVYAGAYGSFPDAARFAQENFPHPLEGSGTWAAISAGQVMHYPDVFADPDVPAYARRGAEKAGVRSFIISPLMREGQGLGAIFVGHEVAHPFSEKESALLKTFSDQAVIAILNARLFNETKEALEQQRASGEVLSAISESIADTQPVFEKILESCERLFGLELVGINRIDEDGALQLAAYHGPGREEFERIYPIPVEAESATAISLRERRLVHYKDAQHDVDVPATTRQGCAAIGIRSVLFAPMLWEGRGIGSIFVGRDRVAPFTEKEIALLKTFADQAVIAMQNARLFNETREALEQQTALSEILGVISSSPTDVTPMLHAVAERAGQLCDADVSAVMLVEGESLRIAADYAGHDVPNPLSDTPGGTFPLNRGSVSGRAILERQPVHVLDLAAEPESEYPVGRDLQRRFGHRTMFATPLMREGRAIGVLGLIRMRVQAFTDKQIALVRTFADQAAIGIANVRLFNETKEALDHQKASAEVLQVISSSLADTRPVFDVILQSCRRLFAGRYVVVNLVGDDGAVHLGAYHGPGRDEIARHFPVPLSEASGSGSAILERRVMHYPDVEARDVPEFTRRTTSAAGIKAILFAPMLREGRAVGAIAVGRDFAGAFSDKEIALLKTFADQAVIAIENARLFKELEARTAELTRSVEQLTALGEVGRAVSASLDLETVLTTIVTQAVRLTGLDGGSIFEYDDEEEAFSLRAGMSVDAGLERQLRQTALRKGEGAIGRVAVTHAPVQIPDILAAGAYEGRLREGLVRAGTRALLAVPMLREGKLVGGLTVTRNQPGEFSQQVVDLLTTFAAQSALAIENARLFADLEQASKHKSEFLANMSHELRTPLNAIIGYSEMLQEEAVDLGSDAFVPDLRKINAAGRHLLELINAVLDLSKIEAGKMELYLEDFSVPAMLDDIAAVIAPLVEKNANRLEKRWDGSIGIMHADLTKTRQALFNLLSNACKFTERGKVALEVKREATERGDWLTFAVRDTGIGMTPEQIERLFVEFSQADASVTRKFGGTGLGLALSRRLARMMGGDIAVASEAGRGSTFTLRLPAVVAEHAPESGAPAPVAEGARRVLVIDDEATVRDLMRRFLAREGYDVVAASNGEEGLRLARELAPDAITLDVMMPGMDGWAVLAALKADAQTAAIPVVMLTIVDDKNLGYALGAADYLTKPIDRDRLLEALAKFRRDRPILVVDDDAAVRELLRRILEKEGYRVVEATNGRAALEALAKTAPGLILLDLMMPEMDGFELVEALREHETWRALPVLVITAKELTSEDRRRLNGYVERILQKGAASREVLLREVGEFVAASTAERQGAKKS